MSSLSEYLAKHRPQSERSVCCVETEYHPFPTVTFCPWQNKEWTVPWARLDSVTYAHDEDRERIEFFFPQHHVIAVGENLRHVIKEIRNFRVTCIRSLPESYRAKQQSFYSFIAHLEVNMVGGQQGQLPKESLF